MLFGLATGTQARPYPEQLSSLIKFSKNCSEEAMSPPDFLIPVAALTATSTTHVAALPPASPAPASPPPVSLPTASSNPQTSALVPLQEGPETSVGNPPGSSPTPDMPKSPLSTVGTTDNSQHEANAVHTSVNQGGPEGGALIPQTTSAPGIGTTAQAAPGEVNTKLQLQFTFTATPAPPVFPDITIASQTYHPTTFPIVTLSGSTVLPNVPMEVSGTSIALQPGGSSLVIDSKTLPIPTPSKLLTLGSNTITEDSASAFVLDGQTAMPGSHAITVSGTTISINPQASNAVINGVTSPVSAASTVVIDGHILTPGLASGYSIGSNGALVAGGQALTVAGTPYSLAPNGTALVVAGTSTEILSPIPLSASPTANLLTIAGSTYTPNSASQYIIGSQTLEPGSAITISGTPIMLDAGATQAVVGSSTETLAQSSTPLASVIMAGFGSQPNGKNVSGGGDSPVVVFKGVGSDKSVAHSLAACVIGMMMGIVAL